MNSRGKLRIATELINNQKDGIGKRFEGLFEEIKKGLSSYKGEATTNAISRAIPEIKLLEDLTFQRFGIKVKYTHTSYTVMAVIPMLLNKYHVLLNESLHGFKGIDSQETMLKTWSGKKGYVDLEGAKVSGIFSTYTHILFMNLDLIFNGIKLSAAEATGVLFHEIGHLFNEYEFSNRLESTNQVLSNLSNELRNGGDQKKIEFMYKEYLDLTGSKEDRELFTSGKTKVVIGASLFKDYFKYVRSQLPNKTNDQTASEVSADIFAARMGYGNHLITALDKLHGGGETYAKITVFADVFMTSFILVLPLAVTVFFLMAGLIPLAVIYSFFQGWLVYECGSAKKDMTYDDLKVRYVKIREQYIQLIKNSDLEPTDAKEIIESIYAVDTIIKSTPAWKPFLTKLSDMLFYNNAQASTDIELQRLLEELAHNELYLKSAELNVNVKGI